MKRSWIGDIGQEQIGQRVHIAGWIDRQRDHGGLVFLDIRDRSGVVQVVVAPEASFFEAVKETRTESCVRVLGLVAARQDDRVNPRLKSGHIELIPESLEVLSRSEVPPFLPGQAEDVDENIRLKYRYLDLRRPSLQEHLRLRHELALTARRHLAAEGFYEIETPTLTRSTPEGARDYLVPARVAPGNFYALPQSPQLYKQLLMVGGLERYFQLARCWRDEDLRADRQPEFTQIDLEMSFVEREDILSLAEGLVRALCACVNVQIGEIGRMSYRDAMEGYGSDKPDLRFGLRWRDLTVQACNTDFGPLNGIVADTGNLRALAVPGAGARPRSFVDALVALAKDQGLGGLAWWAIEAEGDGRGPVAKWPEETRQSLRKWLEASPGDLVLLAAGDQNLVERAVLALRTRLAQALELIDPGTHAMLWVLDFPMFELDDEGHLTSMHHPFTRPLTEDIPLLEHEPLKARAAAYDLVLDGVELGGGSLRIYEADLQRQVFSLLGLSTQEANQKFGFLLDAFRFGPPPHGGIALGFDRLAMLLTGAKSLREVLAFPKNARGFDPMTEAPAPVAGAQLEILGLRELPNAKRLV